MSASISQYVLKVCGRCDLSCDHCYVYEHADQSWRHKPVLMAAATVTRTAQRIADHARSRRLEQVSLVLHGGEPLLLGPDGLHAVVRTLRSVIDPVTRLRLSIHTNGVRLTESVCELFADNDVRVGVSLDGDVTANDRHRRYADGRSSHAQVLDALALLRTAEYRHLYAGILCTVDVANDPIAVYEALLAQDPPRVDFLLPHATWDHPPAKPPAVRAPYAAWLGQIHDRWVAEGRPVPIRFFDSLLAASNGLRSGSEAVGLDPVDLLVVETDGGWEQADSLKTAYDGAPATGMNVFSHSVDEAAGHRGIAARRNGIEGLCETCRACSLVRACGGGLYAHRYKTGNGFDNPSVYCEDLKIVVPWVTGAATPRTRPPGAGGGGGAARADVGERSNAGESLAAPDHVLPDEIVDLLSAGPGDRAAMALLADTQWSLNRLLIAKVAAGINRAGDLGRVAAEGLRLLAALDAEHPAAVREVLTYPYVQAWASSCLRSPQTVDRDLDRAHLAGIAGAAALRAGIEAELALPVRRGSVYLPAVGAFALPAGAGAAAGAGAGAGSSTLVRVSPSGITSARGIRQWQTVRRLSAGAISVTVDDIDPFRDCQAWAPARRLTAAGWESWRQGLTEAGAVLAADLPAYADVIAAGLRSVVPLRHGAAGYRRSGTATRAFGAVAVALPDDADSLSDLILHEMQHVKLTALADLCDLFDRADHRRFGVPWRTDPRPIEGVLHGAYAYLAIAELWWSRANRKPEEDTVRRFRTYRSWVETTIEAMLDAGSLLPAGERFVEGMRATVKGWADDW